MSLSWLITKAQESQITRYQIPSELVKAGVGTIRPDICKLINSIWNKKKLPEEWKQSITVPIYKKDDKTL